MHNHNFTHQSVLGFTVLPQFILPYNVYSSPQYGSQLIPHTIISPFSVKFFANMTYLHLGYHNPALFALRGVRQNTGVLPSISSSQGVWWLMQACIVQ